MRPQKLFTLDIGNSSSKLLCWNKGYPERSFCSYDSVGHDDLVIFSSVKNNPQLPRTKKTFEIKQKNTALFGGMPVKYGEKAGVDRLIFAYSIFQNIVTHSEKFLLIDLGTYCTMDIVTHQGFLGGLIIPGPKEMIRSYEGADQILENSKQSKVTRKLDFPFKDSHSTISNAGFFCIKSCLEKIIRDQAPSKIITTGGGGKLISSFLNEFKIDHDHHPFALHYGIYSLYSWELRHKEKTMEYQNTL